jgi:hypothetical protein
MQCAHSDVIHYNKPLQILDTYSFDRLHIHDVTVTEDAVRLLAVGTLLTSEDGRKPSKCRAEKRIVGE